MAYFDFHPWVRFLTGVLLGCWAGVLVGCLVGIFFAGRRLAKLEQANLLLRLRLRVAERSRRARPVAAGPLLVANPESGACRPATGTDGPQRRRWN